MEKFEVSLGARDLHTYVAAQLRNMLPDPVHTEAGLDKYIDETMTRVYDSFRFCRKKYYREGDTVLFNHLSSDHYASFLYMLSNTVYRAGGDEALATRLFLLNKALHGLDAFYAITLPQVFLFIHPVGTVLGNAVYGNFFVVYQNCGIGATDTGYPTFGDGVLMYAKSACLGGCTVGENTVFAANSFNLNRDVPANSVLTGQYPNTKIHENKIRTEMRSFNYDGL